MTSDGIIEKLQSTVKRVWDLNQQLETVITERPVIARPEITTPAIEPAQPWNARAAYLVLDLHRSARRNEVTVGAAESERGGSSRNTQLALDAIVSALSDTTDDVALDALRWLDQWRTQAELALNLVEPISQLPNKTGEEPMRCPWCDYLTLRVKRITATAYCINPVCRYGPDDPRRPSGRVETDPVTEVISIYWHGELPTTNEDEVA